MMSKLEFRGYGEEKELKSFLVSTDPSGYRNSLSIQMKIEFWVVVLMLFFVLPLTIVIILTFIVQYQLCLFPKKGC